MMKSVQGMHSAGKLNTTKCMSYHWVWGGSFFFRDTTVVYKFLVNPSNQSVLKPPFNLAFLPGSPLSSVWSGIIYAFSHLQKHARFSQHRELTWSKQKKLQHCIYLRILSPCSHHVCFSWPAANFSLFWSVAAGGFNVVRNTCAVVIFFYHFGNSSGSARRQCSVLLWKKCCRFTSVDLQNDWGIWVGALIIQKTSLPRYSSDYIQWELFPVVLDFLSYLCPRTGAAPLLVCGRKMKCYNYWVETMGCIAVTT